MPKKKLKSIRSSKDDADPLSSGLHKNYTTEAHTGTSILSYGSKPEAIPFKF